MKTQIVLGDCASVFFSVPPTKAGNPDSVNGGSPFFPRISSEPITSRPICDGTPARRNHSGLPASLADWLVCKEAVEISHKNCDGAEDGGDAWGTTAKHATNGKILRAVIRRS